MKKLAATLLTLCLVTVVIPPVDNGEDGADPGISTHEYIYRDHEN